MEPTDITIEILTGIREQGRLTHEAITQTNARLDEVRGDLGEVKEGLSTVARRVVESEIRTATAITDMHGTLRDVRDLLREQLDLRPRVERCEKEIGDLRRRIEDR